MPASTGSDRRKIVFLGTPRVAARALELILEAEDAYQVIAVVSQPPTRAPRGNAVVPSPVHALALERGVPVLTPETARDQHFLSELAALAPDLCVTAAYGNVLPDAFLATPKFGTLNIHPSLLPLFRGAAPVQRALEAGVAETGVTVAFTVKAMDAGPILAQAAWPMDLDIKAPDLLLASFEAGARLLVEHLPSVFSGTAVSREQDHAAATKAKKLSVEESLLDFALPATVLHNKVRAFAGWPGTRAALMIEGAQTDVKVVTTRVGKHSTPSKDAVTLQGDALVFPAGAPVESSRDADQIALEVLELQMPGRRVMGARDFWNGLRVKDVKIVPSAEKKG